MNIKLIIQYDGTNFCGSQVQKDQRTVQLELDSALEKLFGQKIISVFSGRTDSGVHAKEQTVNFVTDSSSVPPERIEYPLNNLLPRDILVLSSELVEDGFNSRFDAKKRTYRYFIRRKHELFRSKYSLLYPYDIDIERLNSAAELFKGRRDFKAFCSAQAEVKSHICDIKKLYFFRENDETVMEISSNRFLHNMVRIIVSAFLELNNNRISENDILNMFEKKNRSLSPKTISPKGLFLWKVEY
ncbi:TPA: tRNA pseudouridine(38-40) synthase TruA [Candidatus Delongbacteria bacterium]|nr:MAG: tRNA pseudouridine(38-40) synthase TruA [Candidatus Delongbacteria bacterium GWF2_40_14]HAQ62368.1 tRNA pseudouridine(38-40) synthase TruA [Candidatus Delongbacteria bacterium]